MMASATLKAHEFVCGRTYCTNIRVEVIKHKFFSNSVVLGVLVSSAAGLFGVMSTGDWRRFGKNLGVNIVQVGTALVADCVLSGTSICDFFRHVGWCHRELLGSVAVPRAGPLQECGTRLPVMPLRRQVHVRPKACCFSSSKQISETDRCCLCPNEIILQVRTRRRRHWISAWGLRWLESWWQNCRCYFFT